jgi:uncharacterized membrane protein
VELTINTPALLFPAITLLMLAYTNRFLSLATLVRNLHAKYHKDEKKEMLLKQISSVRNRLNLIKWMQGFGVLSFFCCLLCMYLIYTNNNTAAHIVFAFSLISLLISTVISLIEIFQSTKALEIELSDIALENDSIVDYIKSKLD